jgi:hypothetical protein
MSKVADQEQGARSMANPAVKGVMGNQHKANAAYLQQKVSGPIKE